MSALVAICICAHHRGTPDIDVLTFGIELQHFQLLILQGLETVEYWL